MLKTNKELTMAEKQEIVNAGAKLAEAVETNLDRAHAGALKLVKSIADGLGEGMVGALEAGELKSEARIIAGEIAAAAKRFYLLHRRLTDIAIKHGVDVPQPRDGGGGR